MTTESLKRKAPEGATPKDTEITCRDFETIFREWLLARSNDGGYEDTDEQQEARYNHEEDLASAF